MASSSGDAVKKSGREGLRVTRRVALDGEDRDWLSVVKNNRHVD
jgi:hypothetical protein